MQKYRVDELRGDDVVASHHISAQDAKAAAVEVAGAPVISRYGQSHWFRVVDVIGGASHEFGVRQRRYGPARRAARQ